MKALYAIIIWSFLACIPCVASAMLPTAILPQNGPVRIDECIAGFRGTSLDVTEPYYLDFGANYTNRSSQSIAAVRLRFDVFNAFGEHLQTKYGTDDAQVLAAASQQIDILHNTRLEQAMAANGDSSPTYLPTWEFINTTGDGHSVVCSVDTVATSDGQKWQAPPIKSAAFKAALRSVSAGAGAFYKSE